MLKDLVGWKGWVEDRNGKLKSLQQRSLANQANSTHSRKVEHVICARFKITKCDMEEYRLCYITYESDTSSLKLDAFLYFDGRDDLAALI